MQITIHAVLAGAYKNFRQEHALTHASADGSDTAICGRVKKFALCDEVLPGKPTCPRCAAKLAKLVRS